ncbi:MAG: purine-nucleoside phosphorylase [Rudaea sp.]
MYTSSNIAAAVAAISDRSESRPEFVIVTGSGMAGLSGSLSEAVVIPYDRIPDFPRSTVEGHPGELIIGRLEGRVVAMQRGRTHFYEGHSLAQVTFPIRVLRALGAHTLIVTNAAGGINAAWSAGDLMLITDHIGLPAMAGNNPLFGPNDLEFGPRFPVMAGAYDRELRDKAKRVASDLGFALREGVYCWVAGPSFETPAEIRFLRTIGGDAVGMSTVPEVIVARHAGMRVLGISLISNVAVTGEPPVEGPAEVHQEVLQAGARAVDQLDKLIRGVLK